MAWPDPEQYRTWQEYATALVGLLATTGIDPGNPLSNQLQTSNANAVPPPFVPDGFSPVWLSQSDAALYLGDNSSDPPDADALFQIDTTNISEAAIQAPQLAELSVGTAALQDACIVTAKIGDAQIVTAKIADLAVNNLKVADAAISSAKIANLAVGRVHIQGAAIGSAQIDDLAVTTAHIQDLSVDTLKIANNAVTVPISAYTATNIDLRVVADNTYYTVQSAGITTSGGQVSVTVSLAFVYTSSDDSQPDPSVRLLRDGSVIRGPEALPTQVINQGSMLAAQGAAYLTYVATDLPAAGSHTYEVQLQHQDAAIVGFSTRNRFLGLLEIKK